MRVESKGEVTLMSRNAGGNENGRFDDGSGYVDTGICSGKDLSTPRNMLSSLSLSDHATDHIFKEREMHII